MKRSMNRENPIVSCKLSMTKSKNIACPYCGKESTRATGVEVYPHRPDLKSLRLYRCVPCDALVGTHKGTWKPLGRLANYELRKAKMEAHSAFDKKWKYGTMSRSDAYAWLATQLNIKGEDCHIGMFDVDMCNRVVDVCGFQMKVRDQ